jgi:thiamine-phosphate pyrophosphorylase
LLGRFHLITDTRGGRDPLQVVPAALDAGADVIQVRVKPLSDADALAVVEQALALCAPYAVTCVVDDRLDVALAAGAHGVHLGADDLPVERARAVAGPGLLVGATVRDPLAARRAAAAGASYLGTGPAYATGTKSGLPAPIGVDGVAAVCAAVDLPVIAIGGVSPDRVGPLVAAGAHGVAVIGAVSEAADPTAAARAIAAALAAAHDGRAAGPPPAGSAGRTGGRPRPRGMAPGTGW